MGVVAASVLSGVIVLCGIGTLFSSLGRMVPRGMVVALLVALAVLWTIVLLKAMPTGIRVLLNIVFYFLFVVVAVPLGAGTVFFGVLDRPRNDKAVTVGSTASENKIAIVYHHGMGLFTQQTVTKLADDLGAKGYAVTLYTANARLALPASSYKALVLSSPIYAAATRPPIQDFLAGNSVSGIPCFAALTGADAGKKDSDLATFAALVEQKGGTLTAGAKFISTATPEQTAKEVAELAARIDDTISRRK